MPRSAPTPPVSTSLADARSAELYRRALEVLPGGVNSPVRAMEAIGRSPIFVDRGEGAEEDLADADWGLPARLDSALASASAPTATCT